MKQLLFSVTMKDLQVDFFSGTGAGGQHRNKHQNCVRLRHMDSGAVATGQSARSRKRNVEDAFTKLASTPKFKVWHTRKVNEILTGQTVEAKVEEQMQDKNIKIETVSPEGLWKKEA